jgi:hypothetical protein
MAAAPARVIDETCLYTLVRGHPVWTTKKLLIWGKTYPEFSKSHYETVCTAPTSVPMRPLAEALAMQGAEILALPCGAPCLCKVARLAQPRHGHVHPVIQCANPAG